MKKQHKQRIRKHAPKVAGAVSVVFIGLVALSSGLLSKTPEPRIDSISPAQGAAGSVITLTGSGFTKSTDTAAQTKIGDAILPPGNYLKIDGTVASAGVLSSDGTTLQFTLDLASIKHAKECAKKLAKPEDCKIGLKVVNAYGKESNEVHFLITSGGSVGSGGGLFTPTAVTSSFGWHHDALPRSFQQTVIFGFDPNTVSQVKSFRVYEKTPATGAFAVVATFSNAAGLLSADPTSCGQTVLSSSSQWQLDVCPGGNSRWWYVHSDFVPLSNYPDGEYDFYVTAIDSTGTERSASATLTSYLLGKATVSSPTAGQITSPTPTITYRAVGGLPAGVNYELSVYEADTGAHVGGFSRAQVAAGQTQDSFVYAPDPNDVLGSTLVAGKTYYVEADAGKLFFDGQPTYAVLPDGVLFTVGN